MPDLKLKNERRTQDEFISGTLEGFSHLMPTVIVKEGDGTLVLAAKMLPELRDFLASKLRLDDPLLQDLAHQDTMMMHLFHQLLASTISACGEGWARDRFSKWMLMLKEVKRDVFMQYEKAKKEAH